MALLLWALQKRWSDVLYCDRGMQWFGGWISGEFCLRTATRVSSILYRFSCSPSRRCNRMWAKKLNMFWEQRLRCHHHRQGSTFISACLSSGWVPWLWTDRAFLNCLLDVLPGLSYIKNYYKNVFLKLFPESDNFSDTHLHCMSP